MAFLPGRVTMSDLRRYEEFADAIRLSTSQILSYINALLLDWNDAEDVFQETCVVLWEKFDEFEPGTNFLAWALRIARYKAMDSLKKRGRQAAFHARLQELLAAEIVDRDSEVVAASLNALSGCMDRLPRGDRELVTSCYGESTPVREMANQLGRSPQSVHNSLHRIRRMLLDCVRHTLDQANLSVVHITATENRP
jgi:RNA polymerase sigma-70 factor, ECF subfamily